QPRGCPEVHQGAGTAQEHGCTVMDDQRREQRATRRPRLCTRRHAVQHPGTELGGHRRVRRHDNGDGVDPPGAGTSITQAGTYDLGFDVYKSSGTVWFGNEQRISVMVVPSGYTPLLVDTFDPVPFGSTSDMLQKWNRTGLMKIREDKLA